METDWLYWLSLWSAGWRRQLEKLERIKLDQAKRDVYFKLQEFKKTRRLSQSASRLVRVRYKASVVGRWQLSM
ncbi:MAG: hypothetical protein ACM3NN_07105 [Nitrospirota bacterium]